jgi:non-ribosomal peptide synthetase component F
MFTNTINFDVHVNQVFPPLTVGASLVIAKPEGHLDAKYVVDLMHSQQATGFMFTVPTLAREYVAEEKRRGLGPYLPMRAWGLGGEGVPAEVVRQLQEVSVWGMGAVPGVSFCQV